VSRTTFVVTITADTGDVDPSDPMVWQDIERTVANALETDTDQLVTGSVKAEVIDQYETQEAGP
jgi:hypothetical protein